MLIDNFEQDSGSYILLIAQNAQKSAQNQIASLNTSKNELLKIFLGFRVFEYVLWPKMKTRKCRKSTESFLSQKTLIVSSYHYQETAEKLPIWYLCTILASRTRETPFKLHYNVDVDNFDQYFESCAINTHNAQKSAVNNSVNNLKN